MHNIEVEIRSFIDDQQYQNLLEYFDKNAKLVKEDYQETYYFDGPQDLRIQRNNFYAKIWLKSGQIHDEMREELEIKFDRSEFVNLEKLFITLGYKVKIKWFRNRRQYDWDNIKICLDDTRGYGKIIELEKMCAEEEKETVLQELKNKMSGLEIPLTPKEEFSEKFKYYEQHWQELTARLIT